jgi:hypothetical protein
MGQSTSTALLESSIDPKVCHSDYKDASQVVREGMEQEGNAHLLCLLEERREGREREGANHCALLYSI